MENNFGFGFNDPKFSDRTLVIEIIREDPIHDNLKRRRLISGVEATESNGNQSTKTIHINTLILAAKSPYFLKLFSNGMAESNQRNVTLQILESEVAAFMDLLKFIYTNTLSSTTQSDVLDVLMAADKYEVASCMKYCFELFKKLPMTCESAMIYLDLPTIIKMDDTVQSLVDAAKEFLIAPFNDIRRRFHDMLSLPLVGIEAVLLSDDLQVPSEDDIYDFVMEWARIHYTKPDERQEILTTRLLRLIRFPFMSCWKLWEVLTCKEINLKVSSKIVFHALSSKIPHQPLPSVKGLEERAYKLRPVKGPKERAYKLRPVKVIRFDSPHEECVVYLDLKHEECARLVTTGQIYSQNFQLHKQTFYLMGLCSVSVPSLVKSFGLYLGMVKDSSMGIVVEFEFSYRMKPSEEFVVLNKSVYNFTRATKSGSGNIFGVPWDTFMADDSPYFINGVLHLRAVLKIKKEV